MTLLKSLLLCSCALLFQVNFHAPGLSHNAFKLLCHNLYLPLMFFCCRLGLKFNRLDVG